MDASPFPAPEDRSPDDPADAGPAWDPDPARQEAVQRADKGDLLDGSSARVVLARLIDGDPLELGPRCREQLREGGWLLDSRKLVLRAAARTAFRAAGYRGTPQLSKWLEQNITESIEELLLEARQRSHGEIVTDDPDDSLAGKLAEVLGMEPGTLPLALGRYHGLPPEVRRTFFAIVIDGVPMERYAEANMLAASQVEQRLATALQALGGLRSEGGPR